MDRKPVDLVRVPREERYYDREAVLGRDAASVFPTEIRKAAAAEGAALAELLGGGNKKFISETELEEIKTQRGLSVEDGSIAPEKPLAEILREAKEAKEAAFQEQWKTMKRGKNRPLDEDEFEFLDSVAEGEAAALRRARQEEEDALAAFHAAQQHRQQGEGGEEGASDDQQPGAAAGPAPAPAPAGRAQQDVARPARPASQHKKQPLVAIKPIVRPIVRVKGKAEPAAAGGGGEPASKRQRTAAEAEQQQQSGSGSEGPGLAGLLGGYGSDDGREDS
ncbi:hypothetical protein CHLNCDRAFT_144541 [Chlorella variabilis]|uniref:FAM192A/Fyv6 N-terminal domain-containing protein n=1 Tax=Chlorella variabilis TaxID=554065 RepID=E1ZBM9_CHLVA|nr:hypothetical protein CHLNCDRAFT_144541 [Chlorella variabilis]EFN56884.1 hypothetical protein CHLNCDRAFT_144541 [Chlorella variabilis]|eukprot:XP_005848986.1 hypothetical protein CHLNCDRAFT_144541 [Chlorella variabilis]